MCTGIRLLLLFIPLFLHFSFQLQHRNLPSHFSQELCGLEDWNLVHTWTVGRGIMYTGIRLLLLFIPFISSFFFLSNFQTLNIFVTLSLGTVRPRRLKLGTHMDSGQLYHVYWNQAAALFPLFLHFSFSPVFNIEIFHHFSWELWGLEDWKLVHTWTVVRCIMYTRINCCCLFIPLFLHFSSSPIFNIEIFHHTFLRNCVVKKIETWYTRGQRADVSYILESGCCCLFVPLFLYFLSNFQTWKFLSHFSRELWGLEDWNLLHMWTVGSCIMSESGCCCLLIPLFIFLSLQFSALKFFITSLGNCEA